MFIPTIIMFSLAAGLLLAGYLNGQNQHIAGLRAAAKMTAEILPLLAAAFIVAGMTQTLLPQETLVKWVGGKSGIRGILIGTVAGGLSPGGPFVSLPIVAGMLRAGAGVGTLVAFLTAWSLWAVSRLPMEVGLLGWKFAAIRIASTFFFPPIAGIIAQTFFSGIK